MITENRQHAADSQTQSAFATSLSEALRVFQSLHSLEISLRKAAELCVESLRGNHKLLVCGNGGSACEAQHLVGELMGRYKVNRPSWPAVAINADASILTCIGNDYSFEEVFSRQVEGLSQPGDILVIFTTSGNSPNILRVLEVARRLSLKSVAFLGRDGGAAKQLADFSIIVPHQDTARIQEGHQFLLHALMDHIEVERMRD